MNILRLTPFPLLSVGSQISTAPPSYKRLTSKCSFFRNFSIIYLTVTKIKCIWGKYIYIEAIQITSSSGIYKTNIYHNDCYLRLYVFKFHHEMLIRGSTFFISTLKMKIMKRLVQLFDSTCMHWKCHVTITSKLITRFVYKNLMSVLPPFPIEARQ